MELWPIKLSVLGQKIVEFVQLTSFTVFTGFFSNCIHSLGANCICTCGFLAHLSQRLRGSL